MDPTGKIVVEKSGCNRNVHIRKQGEPFERHVKSPRTDVHKRGCFGQKKAYR
jgi:hypothetical protein